MKILIDDEIYFRQRFGGVSRIFTELIKRILQSPGYTLLFNCFYTENEYLLQIGLNKLRPYLKGHSFPLKSKLIRGICKIISHRTVNRTLLAQKPDVFHPTFYEDYYFSALQKTENTKLVFTVHDLTHEKWSVNNHFKSIALKKEKNIRRADFIIAVSESTKKDILLFYPFVDESRIAVIHLAQSLPKHSEKPIRLPDNYILYVGERFGYKNFEILLHAFAEIRKAHKGINLFCAGGGPFSGKEKDLMASLNIQENVCQAALNDQQLRYVYEHALMFVFPSKYEGFGIPVLEAFESGTPAILSNASSLPEVGSDAALYFDPDNSRELTEKINSLLKNSSMRSELISKGKERVKAFSWDKHFNQTMDVYHRASGK